MKASAQRAAATQSGTAAGVWLVAALAGLLLAACDHDRGAEHRRLDNATAVGLSDPEFRHPMQFPAQRETLDIELPPDADGLSPNQHIDVVRFLERQQPEAKQPAGGVRTAGRSPRFDRASLAGHPAPRRRCRYQLPYYQDDGVGAGAPHRAEHPARLHERPLAIAPTCEDWSEDVGRNEARIAYPNWGCTTVHNLAVMVDSPRDLSLPQPGDRRSSERRAHSWSTSVGNAVGEEATSASSSSKGNGAGPAKQ